jgi:virulence-associated protein VagC
MDALLSRVFMNGNSQAVRIPSEFRLATDRLQISRTPRLICSSIPARLNEAKP